MKKWLPGHEKNFLYQIWSFFKTFFVTFFKKCSKKVELFFSFLKFVTWYGLYLASKWIKMKKCQKGGLKMVHFLTKNVALFRPLFLKIFKNHTYALEEFFSGEHRFWVLKKSLFWHFWISFIKKWNLCVYGPFLMFF